MAELGTRLKEARLAKGYSLEDLQEITKIQKRYLSAIEEGNFSVMPGAFYVRAFIKQYAEAVGLDANEILETYKSEIPANKAAEVSAGTATSIQQPKGGSNQRSSQPAQKAVKHKAQTTKKKSDLMPKIAVAVIVVVVIAIVWFLMQNRASNDVTEDVKQEQTAKTETTKTDATKDDSKEQEVVDQEAEEKAAAEKAAKEKAKAKAKAEKEKAEKEKAAKEKKKAGTISKGEDAGDSATTNYTLSNTKKFKVRVEMTGDNWVGITDKNGANLVAGKMYANGDKLEFDAKGQESIRIRLGAAAAGKVFINNKEVKLLVPASSRPTQNIVVKTK
ncbi:helix-turn-helix domain-containing protein [Kurthia massiliensis]|uniref:helix-turn-helix domain-containing protein n=1 Tax=Kurthia massiliensis TaxID=1033739 RepID=UPI0002892458|nr:helix-turn-helix domain-containing protein [Kurthia massiliensis]